MGDRGIGNCEVAYPVWSYKQKRLLDLKQILSRLWYSITPPTSLSILRTPPQT